MNVHTRWISLAHLVILLFIAPFCVTAQLPTLDIGLFKKDSVTLQVRVRPDRYFDGIFSEVVFTIKWEAGLGTTLGTNYQYPQIFHSGLLAPTKAGSDSTLGNFTYQKFQGNGSAALSVLLESWNANEEIIIMELDVSSTTSLAPLNDLTFEIEENALNFPHSGWNGGYYAELNSEDRSGIVYALIANTLDVVLPGESGQEALKSRLSLFPNPATNTTTLQLAGDREEAYRYFLVDTKGKVVTSGIIPESAADGKVSINLEGIPRGVYVIRIVSNLGETSYLRLLKG